MTFRDEHDNTAEATPDGNGGWNVKAYLSDQFSQALSRAAEKRSGTTTAVKVISGIVLGTGEGMRATGESAGQAVKITGDVGLALTQLSDVWNYGQSAWETWGKEGFQVAFKDMRKAAMQAVALAATAAAASVNGGENPLAKAVAAGLNVGAAAMATGRTRQEQAEYEEEQRRLMYRHAEEGGAQSHLEQPPPQPPPPDRRNTNLTDLSTNASTGRGVNFQPLGRAPALTDGTPGSSASPSVSDMLPLQALSRRGTEHSGTSSEGMKNSGSVKKPPTVPSSSQAQGGRGRGPG